MKIRMNILRNEISKWKSDTPVFWKWIRNTSATITTVISAGLLAVSTGGLVLPEQMTVYLSYALFAFGCLMRYSATREIK